MKLTPSAMTDITAALNDLIHHAANEQNNVENKE